MRLNDATRKTKVCTSCGKEKSIEAFHFKNRLTGRRHSRCMFCMAPPKRDVAPPPLTKTCTKCFREKPIADFPFKSMERGKRHGVCKECAAKRSKDAYYANRESEIERVTDGKRSRREKAREFVSQYLEIHPCVDCGQTNPLVLDFDHRDGKEAHVSQLVYGGASVERVALEISQCEVRCANCHRKETAKRGGFFRWLSSR